MVLTLPLDTSTLQRYKVPEMQLAPTAALFLCPIKARYLLRHLLASTLAPAGAITVRGSSHRTLPGSPGFFIPKGSPWTESTASRWSFPLRAAP